jgi:hypothetical protein
MKHKFQVGDKVRIIKAHRPGRIGTIATVLTALGPGRFTPDSGWYGLLEQGTLMHDLDLRPDHKGHVVAYPPDYLEPYYDGNEKTSWSECVWQPRQVKA